jgi:hypothetical protein
LELGIVGPEKKKLTGPPRLTAAAQVVIGESEESVVQLLGQPDGYRLNRPKRGDVTDNWTIAPHQSPGCIPKPPPPRPAKKKHNE